MKYRTLIAFVLAGCSLAAQARGPVELANAPVPEGARRITYGTDPMHFGELRLPSTKGPHPVAIVVHGGCWLSKLGTYEPRVVSFEHVRPMANALTEAGIATWNIEYRRIDQPGGGWPGTFHDVGAAADFLRTIAAREQLDLNRVIAIGHSAGGHLAMWLAARPKIPVDNDLYTKNPLPLAGVVNLDGPADLGAALPVEKQICGSPVITQMMGGTPAARPDRYRAGSPVEMLPFGGQQVFLAGAMFGSSGALHGSRKESRRQDRRDTFRQGRPFSFHRSSIRDLAGSRAQRSASLVHGAVTPRSGRTTRRRV